MIDEAHFGYIAYSLLKTGRDEHGVVWPLIFKGFGDQRLPLYGYVLIPFVAVFDLSVMSVRLPSALAGSLSIIVLFFFVKKLLGSSKAGLTAALLMAISPWPFMLSRFGFESNLALVFWLLGLNALLRLKEHRYWWVVLAVSFAATWYTYIAYRPITILLLVVIAVYFWLQRALPRKKIILLLVTFSFFIAPLIFFSSASVNTARFNQIGIFHDQGVGMLVNEQRSFCGLLLPGVWCYSLYNKVTIIGQAIFTRFLTTVSPAFLATVGDESSRYLNVQNYGQFYFFLYPFFMIGLILTLFKIVHFAQKEYQWLLLFGLVTAIIPGILVSEPQIVRFSPVLPFIIIFYVIGIQKSWQLFHHFRPKLLVPFSIISIVLTLIFFAQFLTSFFTIHIYKNEESYYSYVRNLIQYVNTLKNSHHIYIESVFSDPLMYYAFYTKMDPLEYQRTAVLGKKEESGFQHTVALGNVFVSDKGITAIGCNALQTKTPTIVFTRAQGTSPFIIYQATSQNKVFTFIHGYDALKYAQNNVDSCAKLPAE